MDKLNVMESKENTPKLLGPNKVVLFFTKYWLLMFVILSAIIFGLVEPAFFKPFNLLDILSSACVTGLMGIGLTCIMTCGELDFSAGSQVSLASVLMGKILGLPWFNSYLLAVIITLLIHCLVGGVNAFLHIKCRIPAFISTMGLSFVLIGISNALTGGVEVANLAAWPDCFTYLGQGYLFGIFPLPMVCLLIIGAGMLIFTERTRFGKNMYAVGANFQACYYVGISPSKQKLVGFLLCSVLCGFAGIVNGSMINSYSPILGDTLMLPAITSLQLGRTFIKDGVFNVPGTLVGAIFLAMITNGMVMVGVQPWMKDVMQGVMLVFSIVVVQIIHIINTRQLKKQLDSAA